MKTKYDILRWGYLVCFALATVLSQCDAEDSSGEKKASTALTLADFSTAYTDALCGFFLGCCPDGFDDNDLDVIFPIADAEECRDYFDQFARLDPARLDWDETQARTCIDQLEARLDELTCEVTVNGAEAVVHEALTECGPFFRGVQAEGNACESDVECAEGLLCSIRIDFSNFHTCYVPGQEGDDCNIANTTCDYTSQIYCDSKDNKCHGLVTEGGDCTIGSCEPSTYCSDDHICVPTKAENEPCSSSLECAPRFICDEVCIVDQMLAEDFDAYKQSLLSESCRWE